MAQVLAITVIKIVFQMSSSRLAVHADTCTARETHTVDVKLYPFRCPSPVALSKHEHNGTVELSHSEKKWLLSS